MYLDLSKPSDAFFSSLLSWCVVTHARIQEVLSEGSTISGPSSACQRNAILMAFRWRADDGPILNAGLVAMYFFRGSKKPYIFVIFQEGSGPPAPPLDPPM